MSELKMFDPNQYIRFKDLVDTSEPCTSFECPECAFHNANGIKGCYMSYWIHRLPRYRCTMEEIKSDSL